MLLLANTGGFGLLAKVADMVARNRGGKSFLSVDDAQQVLPPVAVAAGHAQVACLSLGARLLVFPLDELKHQPNGGRGLTLMDVDAKDPLLSVASFRRHARAARPGPQRQGQGRSAARRGAGRTHGQARAQGAQGGGFVKLLRVAAGMKAVRRQHLTPARGGCRFTSPGAHA